MAVLWGWLKMTHIVLGLRNSKNEANLRHLFFHIFQDLQFDSKIGWFGADL